uniref:ALMS_motif domain-containing protein n=1 Tax=Glossina brevipalpis TaxID=37001 RepID=A0A1A9WAS0_9MUSC
MHYTFKRRNINADSVMEQFQRSQATKIVSPSISYLILAGSTQILSIQSVQPSIHTVEIIFNIPKFKQRVRSQDSTDTAENEKLISIRVYKSPPRSSKTKMQVPTNPHRAHDVLKMTPLAKERASTSKSTSAVITESNTQASSEVTFNTYECNDKNNDETKKAGGYSDLSNVKNFGENRLWKLPSTSRKIRSSSVELNARNTHINSQIDAGQPHMREWLNPMTQSEVEYERKQQAKLSSSRRKANKSSMQRPCSHLDQLTWVEIEIHRLQCLKRSLLHHDSFPVENSAIQKNIGDCQKRKVVAETQHSSDNVYDNVDTEIYEKIESKSNKSSENAEKQKIHNNEVIIEKSNEDVVNLNDNLKRSKERRNETQLIYEKTLDAMTSTEHLSVKPCFRDDHDNDDKSRQREKVSTPTVTRKVNDGSGSSTLRDLVVKHKQKTYEMQQKERDQQKITDSSLPSNNSQKSSDFGKKVPSTVVPKLTHFIYTSADMHASSQELKITRQQDTVATTTTTTSSVSLFCISSDMSVPMGSENSSSTPTTTHHQYEDVADAGVGIPTTDSTWGSYPIYGPLSSKNVHTKRMGCTQQFYKTCSSMASVRIKPKGIAYLIEFTDDEKTNEPDREQQSLDNFSKTRIPTSKSITTYVTNNIKSFNKDTTEQQKALQEYLENSRPNFLQRSKEREALLRARQTMRVERQRQLREIIDNTSFNSLEKRIKRLPPTPIAETVNTKEMKALSSKRFARLPEVVEKRRREREERDRRNNRIIRDLFNQRLQQYVRTGKTSLSHSRTVI